MTRYSGGADFERDVKRDIEFSGWLVIRSAGSRGKADLVAIPPGGTGVALIQCKKTAKLSKKEKDELIEVALAFDCVPVLAYKDGGIRYLELFHGAPMEWHPGAI